MCIVYEPKRNERAHRVEDNPRGSLNAYFDAEKHLYFIVHICLPFSEFNAGVLIV